MLSAIDDGVGRIRETHRKYSIDKNTIIFFISDNGGQLGITKKDTQFRKVVTGTVP